MSNHTPMAQPAGNDWSDHFSIGAATYARYRPSYPRALFSWLADMAPSRNRAWDVATGNGQAARRLAPHFQQVVASDGSARQLAEARSREGVVWLQSRAESAGLGSATVDLVTVAQALHWFAGEDFYGEVRRVARPGAVLAAWTYALARIHPPVDAILEQFHNEVMGPWWPPRRHHVVSLYQELEFPFPALQAPTFSMKAEWTLDELLGYLGTWSSVARARQGTGEDPLMALAATLKPAWGDEEVRQVTWPLGLRVGRVG